MTDWQVFLDEQLHTINEYNTSVHRRNVANFAQVDLKDKGVSLCEAKDEIDRKNLLALTRRLRKSANRMIKHGTMPTCAWCDNIAYVLKPNTYYTDVVNFDIDTIPVCKDCNKVVNHKIRSGRWFIGNLEQVVTWWRDVTNNTIPNWAIALIIGYSEQVVGTVKQQGSGIKSTPRGKANKYRLTKTGYMSADLRLRIAQMAEARDIAPEDVITKALDLFSSYGSLAELLNVAGQTTEGLLVPEHIENVGKGIYYDNKQHVYVRYDPFTRTFLDDILVQAIQEELGERYIYFWSNLL